jgi:hypothetical protein
MAGNLEPNDVFPASALMQLGGRDLNTTGDTQTSAVASVSAGVADMSAVAAGAMEGVVNQTQPWPLMIFDPAQGPDSA